MLLLLVLSSCFHCMTVLLSSSLNDTEIFIVPVIPGGYPINTNIIQYEKGIPKTLGILGREYPKWGEETTVIVHFLYGCAGACIIQFSVSVLWQLIGV